VIGERSRALVDAAGLVILLADADEFVIAAAAGALDPSLVGRRIPAGGSIAERVLAAGRPERLDGLTAAAYGLSAAGLRASSALVVPLAYRGGKFGVIEAFDHLAGSAFREEQEGLLEAAAASAAAAVATAQSVGRDRMRRSLEAAEEERRRWARELHDETLQALAGVRMLLASARTSDDERVLQDVMRAAMERLDTEIESLRVLISELRPAALDELGLQQALYALADRTRATQGIDVAIRIEEPSDGARALDPELETVIYRIVQEALTNAARHAAPDTVEVAVAHRNGDLLVSVADNGRGFDPAQATPGFGLIGMRERVSLVGGRFDLTSSPAGTTVAISLPVSGLRARAGDPGPAIARVAGPVSANAP
jgi:signal transduction histidine kinase